MWSGTLTFGLVSVPVQLHGVNLDLAGRLGLQAIEILVVQHDHVPIARLIAAPGAGAAPSKGPGPSCHRRWFPVQEQRGGTGRADAGTLVKRGTPPGWSQSKERVSTAMAYPREQRGQCSLTRLPTSFMVCVEVDGRSVAVDMGGSSW